MSEAALAGMARGLALDIGLLHPDRPVPAIAITGGIASGKSTFTAFFHAALPGAEAFDADACSRRLLADDPAVADEVHAAFGPAVFGLGGRIDRAALRALVFAEGDDPAPRRALEAILHPRVREAWRGWLDQRLQSSPGTAMVVEIPLLYETGAETFFDHVIVVGCNPEIQRRRLMARRGLAEETACRIIASQWDLTEKIRRCNHLIWNEGSEAGLRAQAERCARYFQSLYPTPPPTPLGGSVHEH